MGVEVSLAHSKGFLNPFSFNCWIKGWEERNKTAVILIIFFLTFKILIILVYATVIRVLHAPSDLNDIVLSSSPPCAMTHVSQEPCPRYLSISWGGGIGKIYILTVSCATQYPEALGSTSPFTTLTRA